MMKYREPVRIPFVGDVQSRSGDENLDQRFENVVFEALKNPLVGATKIYLHKRGGIEPTLFDSVPAGEARGLFVWDGVVFSVFGNTVYRNTVAIITLTTTSGKCGFDLTVDAGPTKLIVTDGTSLYLVDVLGTPTFVPAVNFAHVPKPLAFDGYIVLVDLNGEIRNSDSSNPFVWNPLGTLRANMDADKIVSIVRHKNQIVAIGAQTIEYFYNKGNEPPGSPFERTQQAIEDVGCVAINTITNKETLITFVSQSRTGEHQVTVLNNYNRQTISTNAIDRILEAEGPDIVNAKAVCFRHKGSLLYALTLTNRTLVYNFDAKLWSPWKIGTGPFPVTDAGAGPNSLFLQITATPEQPLGGIYLLKPYVYIDSVNNVAAPAVPRMSVPIKTNNILDTDSTTIWNVPITVATTLPATVRLNRPLVPVGVQILFGLPVTIFQTATVEWSVDSGTTWTTYNPTNVGGGFEAPITLPIGTTSFLLRVSISSGGPISNPAALYAMTLTGYGDLSGSTQQISGQFRKPLPV